MVTLTNCKLDIDTCTLASLPINCGGLGVRRVRDTASIFIVGSFGIFSSKLHELRTEEKEEQARLLAIQRPESGAWLHSLPSKAIGTLLDNNAFRIIVGLRLGVSICVPHTCDCGQQVNSKGRHGLKCSKSAGRGPRHAELNNTLKKSLSTADVPPMLEPERNDGKRVDGVTLSL